MKVSYRIVPRRSELWVDARSSVHPITVETPGLEGLVEMESGAEAGAALRPTGGWVEIESERLKTGNTMQDRELVRRLEMRKYPRVRGEVREVMPLDGEARYRVRGDLSLHGVTRRVDGEVTLRVIDARTIEIQGEKVFDMRDFGLDPPRLLLLRVHPELRVRARVIAQREA